MNRLGYFWLLSVSAALLAGCTMSMEEARQKGPIALFSSAKPPGMVAACIAPIWSSQSFRWVMFDAVVQPGRDGGLMVKSIGANEAVDIVRSGQGSTLKYFSANADSNDAWSRMRITGIRTCL